MMKSKLCESVLACSSAKVEDSADSLQPVINLKDTAQIVES